MKYSVTVSPLISGAIQVTVRVEGPEVVTIMLFGGPGGSGKICYINTCTYM